MEALEENEEKKGLALGEKEWGEWEEGGKKTTLSGLG